MDTRLIRFTTATLPSGTPALRVSAVLRIDTDGEKAVAESGLCVDIPIDDKLWELPKSMRVRGLIGLLDNAFTSLQWFFDHPDEAAEGGHISREHAAAIKTLRQLEGGGTH